ncbi:hypothetical protein JCM15831A_03670 [Asaia astilbis]
MGALALQMASVTGADAIGALLLGTGITKLLDQPAFASVIASYRLMPLGAAFPAARLLGGAQIVTGLWLCSGFLPQEACLVAAALFAVFALAMGINVARGRTDLSCGCLPGHDSKLTGRSVLRTLSLTALMLAAAAIDRSLGYMLDAVALMSGTSLLLLTLASLQLNTAGEPA